MANSVLKIEADITPGNTIPMERTLKKLAETGKQVFSPKMWREVNRGVDEHIRLLTKTQKLTKEQGEAYRQHIIKPLKEQEKLHKSMEVLTRKASARFVNAERNADRFYNRQMRGINPTANPGVAAMYREQADQRYAEIRAKARGDMVSGIAYKSEQATILADQKQERAANFASKIMAIGAATRSVGSGISAFGDVVYGQASREARFSAGGASFAGHMYDQGIRGDYTTLHGILNAPGGLEKFKKLVADSRSASKANLSGQIVSGAGSAVIGAAQAGLSIAAVLGGAATGATYGAALGPVGAAVGGLGGAAVGGLGAWAFGQGLSGMVGGGHEAGSAIQNIRAGKIDSDASEAAIAGAELIKKASPIKLRQLEELQNRLPQTAQLASVMRLNNPYIAMSTIANQGASGGLKFDESMGLMAQLRQGTNDKFAMSHVGKVARMPEELGIGREAAVAGVLGMSRMSGGAEGSIGALHSVLRRATAEGIKDSRLREAIVEQLPAALAMNAGGRVGTTSGMEMAIEIAQKIAMSLGRKEANPDDLALAIRTGKIGDQVTSGTPSTPMYLGMQDAAMKILLKMGLRHNDAMSIAGIGYDKYDSESSRQRLTESVEASGQKPLSKDEMNAALTKLRKAKQDYARTHAKIYRMTPGNMFASQFNEEGDTAAQQWWLRQDPIVRGQAPEGRDPKNVPALAPPLSAKGQEAVDAQKTSAMNSLAAILGAFGDPALQTGLKGTIEATKTLSGILTQISDQDITKLREVGEILSKLGTATGNAPGAIPNPAR